MTKISRTKSARLSWFTGKTSREIERGTWKSEIQSERKKTRNCSSPANQRSDQILAALPNSPLQNSAGPCWPAGIISLILPSENIFIQWQLNWVECNLVGNRKRDFKIGKARSASSIWNHKYDFRQKLNDTRFNYHFITQGHPTRI